jgi:hypothetical protein
MDEIMEQRWRKQRRNALGFLYFAALCTGVLGPRMDGLRPDYAIRVQLLTAILFSLGSMWFCTADARLASRPLIPLARVGIFLGWPVGVPIYLLSVRGIRGLGVLLLHACLLFLVLMCSGVTTTLLVRWDAFFA